MQCIINMHCIIFFYNSVSHGDPITLYGGPGKASYIYVQRVGRTCILNWSVSQSTATFWQPDIRIPEELRPAGNIYVPGCVTNNDGYVLNVCAYCYINTSGYTGFQVASAVSGAINRGICSWAIG